MATQGERITMMAAPNPQPSNEIPIYEGFYFAADGKNQTISKKGKMLLFHNISQGKAMYINGLIRALQTATYQINLTITPKDIKDNNITATVFLVTENEKAAEFTAFRGYKTTVSFEVFMQENQQLRIETESSADDFNTNVSGSVLFTVAMV